MLVMLFLSMLTLAFNIQPSRAEPKASIGPAYTPSLESAPGKLDFTAEEDLQPYDGRNDAIRELIVGVDVSKSQAQVLGKIISDEGGNVTDTISTRENVRALSVKVPTDYAYFFTEKLRANELVKYVEPNPKVQAFYVPNDPYWSFQWGPKKIQADKAWDKTIGSSSLLVAIIDTGIDYTHSDLAANYVPLGYDWVNDDTDPIDDNGHGTHCAGIVAAKLNNGIGIAGLAQVRIMTEKVLNAGGWGYYSWVTQGIYHAVDVGAKIISLSLGGSSSSEQLQEAVKYAHDHGVLVIAAAGNEHSNLPHYPAAYNEVVAVSATDSSDNVAGFSNFGNWIDLAAPGVDVYSTFLGNHYASFSGTSMACPHVTGVAALAWSVFSNYTVDQIRKVLQRTADDLGGPGFDERYGYGRVNARRAVEGIPEHDVSITGWNPSYRLDPGQIGIFNVTVSNYGRNNETNVSVQFFINGTLVDEATIDSLEVDASASLSFSWDTATKGVYNATCYVVPVPDENVIENNVAYAKVAVRFISILRVPTDYSTVKAAVNDAFEGDIILVSDGTYAEGQIDIFKDNITLIADGQVTLDGWLGGYVLNIMANHVVVDGFDIRNGTTYGVYVRGSDNIITRNTIVRNRDGVRLYSSENCLVNHNIVASGGDGIDVEYSSNNTISQNRLVSGSFLGGINLWQSSNNTITENTMTGGILCGAILLYLSENNFIASNNITNNRCGIALVSSPNNVLRNNVLTNNWCNFDPWMPIMLDVDISWRGPSDVDTSNTVDGKPIYYWVNVTDRVVPSDAGCVVLVNCENITAENLDIKNNYNGILLFNSRNILIRRNNITDNWTNFEPWSSGIFTFEDSYNITITQNNIMTNANGLILLGYNNTISQNNFVNNYDNAIVISDNTIVTQNNITGHQGNGVAIFGSNCTISSNNIVANLNVAIYARGSNHKIVSNNIIGYGRPFEDIYLCSHEGILLWLASNCTVSSNNVIERDDPGIWTLQASNNMIFHNNFIKNPEEFYSFESVNTWDNGYPSGGNYWSSYAGVDQKHGPNQDQPGADGIGDTPQVLDADNSDRYPLMTPYVENPPPQTYQLTITGVIDNSPIKGFYNTPYPRPGTYVFVANSPIRVDTHLYYNTFVDHWELDGVNVGSNDYITILMNKDHSLKAVFSSVPPLIVSINPTIANIDLGESVTFTSSVSGGKAPYEYQWYLNGIEVLDETYPTWTFTPKKLGTYYISLGVSYPFSTPPYSTPVMSDYSTVNVGPLFDVSISPTSVLMYVGESVSFVSNISSGFLPFNYQWYLNDKPVSGARASAWTFTPNLSGKYSVYLRVTDGIGIIVESNEASATVALHPAVSISPKSVAILVDKSITFTSTVWDGFKPYRYQWYLNDEPISGATTSMWTFTPTTPGDFNVSLIVADSLGFTTKSNTAPIRVREQLVVSILPASASVHVNQIIEFTSTTSGGYPPYNYQWYLNDNPVLGATASSWIFTSTKPGDFNVSLEVVDNLGFTTKSNTACAKITILGDLNGDGKVDIKDIATAALAFGSYPDHPKWNPIADVDQDGKIYIKDLAVIAKNFGKTYP